jgi:beta-phosphoglucomutase-like phosphatase (HAD superfamily)
MVVIRALVFDFDGLILETETPAYQAWVEVYREFGHELPKELWLDYIGREGGSDDFFNAGFTRSIGEQSRVNAVAGNYSERIWNIHRNSLSF